MWKEEQSPRVKKERKPTLRGKWESVFSGMHMDNVPKESRAVSVVTQMGRPDILWSVNKLARSITKWTQACDRRPERLISCIHHTNDFRLHCHVGNTAQHCRLGLFQDSGFTGDLEDSKSTSGRSCVFLEVEHLFLSVGCARNKLLSGCRIACGWVTCS